MISNLGQLKVYKLMFALELSMEKWLKKFWAAGFSVIPEIIAFGFSNQEMVNFIGYKCRVIAYFDDGFLDKHTHNVRRNLL